MCKAQWWVSGVGTPAWECSGPARSTATPSPAASVAADSPPPPPPPPLLALLALLPPPPLLPPPLSQTLLPWPARSACRPENPWEEEREDGVVGRGAGHTGAAGPVPRLHLG